LIVLGFGFGFGTGFGGEFVGVEETEDVLAGGGLALFYLPVIIIVFVISIIALMHFNSRMLSLNAQHINLNP
jgi:hypothetical protein